MARLTLEKEKMHHEAQEQRDMLENFVRVYVDQFEGGYDGFTVIVKAKLHSFIAPNGSGGFSLKSFTDSLSTFITKWRKDCIADMEEAK